MLYSERLKHTNYTHQNNSYVIENVIIIQIKNFYC